MIGPRMSEISPYEACRSNGLPISISTPRKSLSDTRREYGEIRYVALGMLDRRLHVLIFTNAVKGIRVISLRRANKREVKRYGT